MTIIPDWITKIQNQIRAETTEYDFRKLLIEESESWDDKGGRLFELGEHLEFENLLLFASVAYQLGVEKYLSDGNTEKAFAGYTNTGLFLDWVGQPGRALELFGKAKALIDKYGMEWVSDPDEMRAKLYVNWCDTLVKTRKTEEAFKLYAETIKLCKNIGNDYDLARCYIGEGNAYRNLGKFRMSLNAYEKADALLQSPSEDIVLHKARANHGMCNVLLEYNQVLAGIEAGVRAQEFYAKAGDKQGVMEAMLVIGHAYHSNAETLAGELNRTEREILSEALRYNKSAYDEAKPHDRLNMVDAQLKLAILAQDTGDYKRAMELYQLLTNDPVANNNLYYAAQLLQGKGTFYLLHGEPDKAIALFQEGYDRDYQARNEEGMSKWNELLGSVYEQKNEIPNAIKCYQNAIDIQEQLGVFIEKEYLSIGYFSKRFDVYNQLIALLLSQKRYAEAHHYLQRSKAKVLRGRLDHFAQGASALKVEEIRLYL